MQQSCAFFGTFLGCFVGRRGPKPKPNELHAIAGTLRPDRHPPKVEPKQGRPHCPAFLGEIAKAEWDRVVPLLDKIGLLALVDRATLATYCQLWEELQRATETLAKEGRYVKNVVTGVLHPHPALTQQRAAALGVKQYAAMFGLSPADRIVDVKGQGESLGISAFARKRS